MDPVVTTGSGERAHQCGEGQAGQQIRTRVSSFGLFHLLDDPIHDVVRAEVLTQNPNVVVEPPAD